MTLRDEKDTVLLCDGCGEPMRSELAQMPMWFGAELNLIDGVPTHVCDACNRQQFTPRVDAAIRRLVAAGFPGRLTRRQIAVPLFDIDDFAEQDMGVAAE